MNRINLLPPEYQAYRPLNKKRLLKTVLVLLVVFSLIFGYGLFYVQLYLTREYMADLKEKMAVLQPVANRIDQLEIFNKEATKKLEYYEQLNKLKFPWSQILLAAGGKLPQGAWLTEINFQGDNPLVLKGMADDFTAVGQFVLNLETLDFFGQIILQSAEEIEYKEQKVVSFTIKCYLPTKGGDRSAQVKS